MSPYIYGILDAEVKESKICIFYHMNEICFSDLIQVLPAAVSTLQLKQI